MQEYYDRRAPEYDASAYEAADAAEVASLTAWVARLAPGRELDVACGTGYLTRFLRGDALREELHGEVALETPRFIALVARPSGRFRGM
jgi:ubiquinone/menaquinone biosynthesis C-methylase UbiE